MRRVGPLDSSRQLDRLEIPKAPLDILAQQIVAERRRAIGRKTTFTRLVRRTYSYRDLERKQFRRDHRNAVRRHRDAARTQWRVPASRSGEWPRARRRGARLAAITSGGAIPETANYSVVAEPDGKAVGNVDEDFAVESLAGDVFLLGTSSWRIKRVEPGRVRVEDAHGAPPSVPFWNGEAPGRTVELSEAVGEVREEIARDPDSALDCSDGRMRTGRSRRKAS